MTEPRFIVLTGGPCSGKTTIASAIKEQFGERVVMVKEAASIQLSGGFPMPNDQDPWAPEWQVDLQRAIYALQFSLENIAIRAAKKRSCNLIVCDRGLLDGACYLEGGLDEFSRRFNVDIEAAIKRYAAVIHLESLATSDPERYGKTGNEARFEPLERAQHLEYMVRKSWEDHPKRSCIFGQKTIGAKTIMACSIIQGFLEK